MIKIVSGFTIPVGSTIALVNLCNQMNGRGQDCILYGPDRWHLDKCRSAGIADFRPQRGDAVIVHHIRLFCTAELFEMQAKVEALRHQTRWQGLTDRLRCCLPGGKKDPSIKLILSCQANEGFPLRRLSYSLFDMIHYAHGSQVGYHGILHNHFVCPNFINSLIPSAQKPIRVGGIIGSICRENETHGAIEMALKDGMDTVVLYGYMHDPLYYYKQIVPLTKNHPGRIKYAGFIDDRQRVYDALSDVYSAVSRPWSPVMRECAWTNTRYHGPDVGREAEALTDDQGYAFWKRALAL